MSLSRVSSLMSGQLHPEILGLNLFLDHQQHPVVPQLGQTLALRSTEGASV